MRFKYKNLLVTGGAGFIGSNFIEFILSEYSDFNIYNLDLLTYAGNIKNTRTFKKNDNYKFIKGDITDEALLTKIFKKYKIDGVINFAAETHVDNSISNPKKFIITNINGVFNLLKTSYNFWHYGAFKIKNEYKHARFHQISTDEVYGSIDQGSFTEKSSYLPNSPYSASKASADMLVRSFYKTYGLNVTTSISSNNYGLNQHQEKFIPKILSSIKNNTPIHIYGDGLNTRNWLYVIDHCKAISAIFQNGKIGEKFNIGSNLEISNLELVNKIYKFFDKTVKINFISDRFGHDFRYSLDSSKIKSDLNWKCESTLEDFLQLLG